MAEEVKKTSPGGSMEGIETVEGNPNQNRAQDAQGIEGKATEVAEVKSDGGSVLSGDEKVGESDGDAGSADSSEMGEAKREVDEEEVPSGEPEEGKNVKEKGEGEDKTERGEVKESDVSEPKGRELPAEAEAPAKEEAQVGESASEARPKYKEELVGEAGKEVIEEKGKEKAEAEGLTEGKAADQEGETGRQEVSAEESREAGKSGEEATVVESGETEAESEVAEKEDEIKGAEEEIEENLAQGGEGAVAEEERDEGLVSSEELTGEAGGGVIDEEWITWKKEFLNKFHRRVNKKWIIPGATVFMLFVGLVGFLVVPNLLFINSGEVKSLKEIAGPVRDMKFFLPLAVDTGRKRFVKVTVAIELVDNGFKKEIDKKVSELRKEVIDLVLTKSPKEVRSARGKEILRQEITTKLNIYLSKNCIKNTYFTELVVL